MKNAHLNELQLFKQRLATEHNILRNNGFVHTHPTWRPQMLLMQDVLEFKRYERIL